MKRRDLIVLLGGAVVTPAVAADSDVALIEELLKATDDMARGESSYAVIEMHVKTDRYERTMVMEAWSEGTEKTLIRIKEPAKDAGISTLKVDDNMWNYLPNIERTIKIPPSMMLQPWMGSDFTNDDLVKQSSAVDDYTHRVLRTEVLNGAASYVIESIPKPDAAVVWGKILYWIRQADTIPLKQYYYNERNELVRVLTFSDVGPMGGRTIPTKWEMRPVNDPGHATVIVVKAARYDQPIDDERFTQRNLQKP